MHSKKTIHIKGCLTFTLIAALAVTKKLLYILQTRMYARTNMLPKITHIMCDVHYLWKETMTV